MRNATCIFVFALIMDWIVAVPTPFYGQEKEEAGEGVYTVKKGDTLWDISSKFLKDPFLWPKLWQRNPYITNPHWIYPGNPVQLSPLEEPKKVVEGPREPLVKKEGVAEERKLEPAEVKPPFFETARAAGFFSDVDLTGMGVVVESQVGKNLLATGDVLYLAFRSREPVKVGDKFSVYRAMEVLKDPVTYRRIGRRYIFLGNLQIIDQYGNFHTGEITDCIHPIERGDMIFPYLKEKMEAEAKK